MASGDEGIVPGEQQMTQFGLDLMKVLYKEGTNLVMSPYSIVSALMMVLPGAKEDTRDQLLNAMFGTKSEEVNEIVDRFVKGNNNILAKNGGMVKIANHLYTSKRYFDQNIFT